MPVILPEREYKTWLQPDEALVTELKPLLIPYPSEEMTAYPVSRLVNNPANESPSCIQPQ
jgi:putative SOS response-associated peptidase YedK